MWPDTHFHEKIDYKRIHVLSKRADLRIKRIQHFSKGPLYWPKKDIIRPTLRILLGGWFYIEMEKNICSGEL